MNQPPSSTPGAEELRLRLQELRRNLLALHKTLIDSERLSYEQTFGPIESQNRFLGLLINDPWFMWLHPLSELVVLIDEAMEAEVPVTTEDMARLIVHARNLLKASEEGDGFARSYFDALQREPDVVLAHADVVRCFSAR